MSSKDTLFENSRERHVKLLSYYGKTPEILEENIRSVKEWLKKEQHLPEIKDDSIIQSFLRLADFSVEETKRIIDFYFTFRSTFPSLFKHPLSSEMINVSKMVYFVPISNGNDDLKSVMYCKLIENDIKKFNWSLLVSHVINVYELMIAEDFSTSSISVYDLSGIKAAHFSKVEASVLKNAHIFLERILRKKFNCAYIINIPGGWDPFFKLLLSVVNKNVKIIVDQDSSSLLKLFPKELLPLEFGGSGRSLADTQEVVKAKFAEHKPLFDFLHTAKVNEDLRRTPSAECEYFSGVQGSFQKLEID